MPAGQKSSGKKLTRSSKKTAKPTPRPTPFYSYQSFSYAMTSVNGKQVEQALSIKQSSDVKGPPRVQYTKKVDGKTIKRSTDPKAIKNILVAQQKPHKALSR